MWTKQDSIDKVANLLSKNAEIAKTYQAPPHASEMMGYFKQTEQKLTVIITCADPRAHPETFMNSDLSQVAVIRNAGGRASDALRSLIAFDAIFQGSGIGTVLVVHHTDCGMTQTDEKGFCGRIGEKHPAVVKSLPEGFVWGAINDPEKSVKEDVEYLKSFPSIEENVHVVGLVLDTFTGLLTQVA